MKIYYLHHLPFPWGRAHDVHVIKTVYYLARSGIETLLLAPIKKGFSLHRLLTYYGLGQPPYELRFIPFPTLRKRGFIPITSNALYDFILYLWFLKAKRALNREKAVLLFSEKRLTRIARKCAHGQPAVFEIHGLSYFKRGKPDPREKEALEEASLGLVTTQSLKNLIAKIYGPSTPLIHLPLASEPMDSQPYTGPKDPPLMVYVGQLYETQGVEVLLRAMPHIKKGQLIVIGGQKKQVKKLEKLALELGQGNRIAFLGYQPHRKIKNYLLAADLLILPALSEGKQPYVAHQKLYEYFSAGRPIIASDLPSIREEITKDEALLFPPGDPETLAKAANEVLLQPKLARELARKAFLRAKQFDWPARTRKLIRILEETCHV
ncbi:glycosyltransferase family 4 protein [Thermosulfurimonas dismutans]|uniref:Glycosyl transferase family 1 domain-containing protein n=1 Tax=Thermosulfurimonas dismutans TaxID=999894 RepID=A0A179D7X3_9BACT|nr:glycosyltransferase family 4 protein [Thermosulfurimonas dismutans]OAQ21829.1 hypothetical protein TDIS_0347 [Thermosulfurimonas dismutans]